MTPVRGAAASQPAFMHQACLYDSDGAFLAMAVPFIEDGLRAGEPVLAVTTSANLDLLRSSLGNAARGFDYAESSYFGRLPAHRVAAFDRYWKRHADSAGRVRILAEPVWAGRPDREIRAWKQMEACLNLIFADSRIWMICPYDSRILRPDILADASRTHPSRVEGQKTLPSAHYADPAVTARGFGAEPLLPPPADAAAMTFTGDLAQLRAFVADAAASHGLAGGDAVLFVIAAAEAASYFSVNGRHVALAVWERPGGIVCDLHQAGGSPVDPLLGLRPPELDGPRAGDGLWLTRQLTESVQIRSTDAGSTIRLQVPTPRALV